MTRKLGTYYDLNRETLKAKSLARYYKKKQEKLLATSNTKSSISRSILFPTVSTTVCFLEPEN